MAKKSFSSAELLSGSESSASLLKAAEDMKAQRGAAKHLQGNIFSMKVGTEGLKSLQKLDAGFTSAVVADLQKKILAKAEGLLPKDPARARGQLTLGGEKWIQQSVSQWGHNKEGLFQKQLALDAIRETLTKEVLSVFNAGKDEEARAPMGSYVEDWAALESKILPTLGFTTTPKTTWKSIPIADTTLKNKEAMKTLTSEMKAIGGIGAFAPHIEGNELRYLQGQKSMKHKNGWAATYLRKAVEEQDKLTALAASGEDTLLSGYGGFSPALIAAMTDDQRKEALRASKKIEEAADKGLAPNFVEAMTESDLELKRLREGTAKAAITAMTRKELAGKDPSRDFTAAPVTQREVDDYAARHNMLSTTGRQFLDAETRAGAAGRRKVIDLSARLGQAEAAQVLAYAGSNATYAEQHRVLQMALADKAAEEKERWDTVGPGSQTERGRRRADRRARREQREREEQERFHMRGSGRVGRTLRSLGVDAKIAGNVGRVFGKAGKGAAILAAIVKMGQQLYEVLNRIHRMVAQIGGAAIGRSMGDQLTGISSSDQRFYGAITTFAHGLGFTGIDLNQSHQNVANKLGNILLDGGAGLTATATALFPLFARLGMDDRIDGVVNLATNRGPRDVSRVANDTRLAAFTALARGQAVVGNQESMAEIYAQMAQVGMSGEEISLMWTQMEQHDNFGAFREMILDAARRGLDSTAVIQHIYGTIVPSAQTARAVRSNEEELALRQHGTAFANEATRMETALSTIRENLTMSFGAAFLSLIESFNNAILRLLIWIQDFTGFDIVPPELMLQHFNQTQEEIRNRNVSLRGAQNNYRSVADRQLEYFFEVGALNRNTENMAQLRTMFSPGGRFGEGKLPPNILSNPELLGAFVSMMAADAQYSYLERVIAGNVREYDANNSAGFMTIPRFSNRGLTTETINAQQTRAVTSALVRILTTDGINVTRLLGGVLQSGLASTGSVLAHILGVFDPNDWSGISHTQDFLVRTTNEGSARAWQALTNPITRRRMEREGIGAVVAPEDLLELMRDVQSFLNSTSGGGGNILNAQEMNERNLTFGGGIDIGVDVRAGENTVISDVTLEAALRAGGANGRDRDPDSNGVIIPNRQTITTGRYH